MRSNGQRGLVASVAVHAVLLSIAVVAVPAAQPAPSGSHRTTVDVDVVPRYPSTDPVAAIATAHGTNLPVAPTPHFGGTRSPQNVSADQSGERGDGRSPVAGRVLAARADGVNLDPHLVNNLAALEEQRIRSARHRASPQDERRTPHPDGDPWLSTGQGVLLFRVTHDRERPTVGAVLPAGVAVPPGFPQSPGEGTLAPRAPPGAHPRVAAGVEDNVQGRAHRAAGPIAMQRPDVELGHPTTTADTAALHPDDTQDAALLAAALTRSYTAASVQDGTERRDGVGGVGGGGAPGSGGGRGRGGRAQPAGEGDGWLSLGADDARYVRYFNEVRRRLDPLWARAFPDQDALQLRQGTVDLAFVIEPDGGITDVRVVRRSGVEAFDTNVRNAITGARVPPVPASLGRIALHIRHSFRFRNPVVR